MWQTTVVLNPGDQACQCLGGVPDLLQSWGFKRDFILFLSMHCPVKIFLLKLDKSWGHHYPFKAFKDVAYAIPASKDLGPTLVQLRPLVVMSILLIIFIILYFKVLDHLENLLFILLNGKLRNCFGQQGQWQRAEECQCL